MRKFLSALVVLGAASVFLIGRAAPVVGDVKSSSPPAFGFAVLELFTSEGCSSCPPADQVLGELATQYAGRPVFPLSFHVDYWNDLGWRDRYSDPAFSRRQRSYATSLGRAQIYTPQLVINGQSELVGSHAAEARARIESALSEPRRQGPAIVLSACAAGEKLEVQQRTARAPSGAQLALLLVQEAAESRVTRGENAGRTLPHSNVVRALLYAAPERTARLPLPADARLSELSLVALLEEPSSHAVLAAVRTRSLAACPAR